MEDCLQRLSLVHTCDVSHRNAQSETTYLMKIRVDIDTCWEGNAWAFYSQVTAISRLEPAQTRNMLHFFVDGF